MKEKSIENKIKEYLKTLPDAFFWKNHGGMYSVAGLPDIMVVYQGKLYCFEIKNEIGTTTKLQEITIDKLRKAGVIAEVVRSKEEVMAIIESRR